MRGLNANGDGNSLVFNGWGFRILLLTAQKFGGTPIFPIRDESPVQFSNMEETSGYFSHRGQFFGRFPNEEASHRGCDKL